MGLTKVFVETSVLISASVYAKSEKLGVELIHHFYNISSPLFDFFKEHIDERIGITTAIVEDEARTALTKAVTDALVEKAKSETERSVLFQAYAALLDISFDNLHRNLAVLLREPVLDEERNKVFSEVSRMYYDLESKGVIDGIEREVKIRTRYLPPHLKRVAKRVYRDQFREEYIRQIPLKKLRKKPVGERDKQILADAVCVLKRYKRRAATLMFFASTDHHFSPVREIRTLTDEIKKRFDIICDWPDKILEKVAKIMKKSGKK